MTVKVLNEARALYLGEYAEAAYMGSKLVWRSGAPPYRSVVMADEPMAYYRLGDEGAAMVDQMGGAPGTFAVAAGGSRVTAPSLLPNGEGRSTSFTLAHGAPGRLWPAGGPISIEAWVLVPTELSVNRPIWRWPARSAYPHLIIWGGGGSWNNPGAVIIRGDEAGFGWATDAARTANGLIQPDVPYHIVMVRPDQEATNTIYVNGVDATLVRAALTSAGSFSASIGDNRMAAEARMQEVAVYDYALTPQQVRAHYLAGWGATPPYERTVREDRPFAYYRLGDSGTAMVDAVEGNAAGAYTGAREVAPSILPSGEGQSQSFTAGEGLGPITTIIPSAGPPWSHEIWLRLDSLPDPEVLGGRMAIFGSSSRYTGFLAVTSTGALVIGSDIWGTGWTTWSTLAGVVSAGEAFHIVAQAVDATWPGESRLYVNGRQVSATLQWNIGGAGPGNQRMLVGRPAMWGWVGSLVGCVQEAAVYDHLLTPERVREHYAAALPPYPDVVMADAPLAYHRLDDTGTNAANEMGGATGVYSGSYAQQTPSILPSGEGKSVYFDSVGVVTTGVGVPTFGAPTTWETWFKVPALPTSASQFGLVQVLGWIGGAFGPFWMVGQNGVMELNGHQSGHTSYPRYRTPAGLIEPGRTYHVVITGRSTDPPFFRCYINGSLVSAGGTTAIVTGSQRMNIGFPLATAQEQFAGWFQEAAFYDYELSPEQVFTHYLAGGGR